MKHPFVNLTNHPAAQWSEAQRRAAEEYGPILELPFPAVPETADLSLVSKLAALYFRRLRVVENPVVLVQGEAVFTYILVRLLEQARIPALACVSRRCVQETLLPDGTTEKLAVYSFAGFRPYWESGLDAFQQNDV